MLSLRETFFSEFSKNEDLIVFLFLLTQMDDEGIVDITQKELLVGSRLDNTIHLGAQVRRILDRLASDEKITYDTSQHGCTKIQVLGARDYIKNNKSAVAVQPKQEKVVDTSKAEWWTERLKQAYPNISKMKKPLTLEEWNTLIREGYTKDEILHIMDMLNNYMKQGKPCYMCYINCLLTMRNWLKNERKRQQGSTG